MAPGNIPPVRALFVLKQRYLQPRPGEGDFLQRIEIFDLFLKARVQNGVCQNEGPAATAPNGCPSGKLVT